MNTSNRIKILSPEQAMKIAAGEVVERPINIIKELVENSIDAQATKISIIIHGAGKNLIKIIDNGCGMNSDDAKLSVAQHATSKINRVEDLETIATFGFRGEALASINAVSNLTIITKTQEAQAGTFLRWNFGKLQEESIQAHPTGTTIEIANLFDNIPARQKFLKKDETEWRAIVNLFQAFCLDYIHIHFQLYNQDKLEFNCPAVSQVSDRAAQIFDGNLHHNLVPLINLDNNLCSVTGLIGKSNYYRYDRNQIFIFVNQRWVKNIDLTKAIMRGYAGMLPPQKYPAAIIFITIDPTQVDVNIHPKKEEVKFLHPKKIDTIIINSIQATLEQQVSKLLTSSTPTNHTDRTADFQRPAPFSFFQQASQELTPNYECTIRPSQTISQQNSVKTLPDRLPITPPVWNYPAHELIHPKQAQVHFEPQHQNNEMITIQDNEIQSEVIATQSEKFVILGQYKLTYILLEQDNNLVLVDQHAAHERILYEEFKNTFNNIATIQLIFPEFIKLSTHDLATITPYLALLKEHGIDAEIFSDTQLLIQATPVHLKNQLLQETIQQIIGWIKEIDEPDSLRISHLLHEKIHTKMACSAAIKAGDSLNREQMEQLLNRLKTIEHRFSCPHGRPTSWILPLDHIEKQFKRDYGKKAEQFYDFL